MIKGIIFDMVGPLLQEKPNYIFDEIVQTAEKIRSQCLNDKKFVNLLKKNEITRKYTTEEIAKKIVSKYCKVEKIWNELLPKLKNYKLGVINNGTSITIPYFKEVNNFDEFFTIFINSSEVGLEKPDSKIYMMTLNKMRLKPEESIFIDDSESNVVGANNMGIIGLLYTDYEKLICDLRSSDIKI